MIAATSARTRCQPGRPRGSGGPTRGQARMNNSVKKVILPADLSDLLATGNTSSAIISLLDTMPAVDRAALGIAIRGPVRVKVDPADLESTITAQPVEVLRSLAMRHLSKAALRQHELNQRDACYR